MKKILLIGLLVVGLMGVSTVAQGVGLDLGLGVEGPLGFGYGPSDYMFQVGAKSSIGDATIAGGIAVGSVHGQGPCWGPYGKISYGLENFFNLKLNLEGTMLFSWRSNWDMCNSGLRYSAIKAWVSHPCLPVYVGVMGLTIEYPYDLVVKYGPFIGASLLCGPIQLYGELFGITECHPYWYSGQWNQLNFNIGVKIPL